MRSQGNTGAYVAGGDRYPGLPLRGDDRPPVIPERPAAPTGLDWDALRPADAPDPAPQPRRTRAAATPGDEYVEAPTRFETFQRPRRAPRPRQPEPTASPPVEKREAAEAREYVEAERHDQGAALLDQAATSDDLSIQAAYNTACSALLVLDLLLNAPTTTATPQPPAPKRPRRPRTSPDVDEITRRYTNGQTPPQIGTALGHTPTTIRRVLDNAGVPLRDDRAGHSGGANRVHAYPDHLVADIRRLYTDEHLSQAGVAARLGITTKVVQLVMRKHSITSREAVAINPQDGAAGLRARIEQLGGNAEIRAWAARTAVDCPAVGTVPTRVVDAYEASRGSA